jgi:hypothetical protein
MPVAAGMCASVGSVTIDREADNHHSQGWVRVPNELKLMFADCLDVDDINSLARTSRAENRLLTTYMYRRARDLCSSDERPYFLKAVKAGNLTAVRHFIAVGTSVNTSDPREYRIPTALHRCVREGYIEMAQLLIQHGVDMSPVNDYGHTPLREAIGRKSEKTWVRLLVDAGADICATTVAGDTILSCATACGKLSTVQLLLERGAIPTTRNRRRRTLLHVSLHYAAASQRAAKLGLLLEAGLCIIVHSTGLMGRVRRSTAPVYGRRGIVCGLACGRKNELWVPNSSVETNNTLVDVANHISRRANPISPNANLGNNQGTSRQPSFVLWQFKLPNGGRLVVRCCYGWVCGCLAWLHGHTGAVAVCLYTNLSDAIPW